MSVSVHVYRMVLRSLGTRQPHFTESDPLAAGAGVPGVALPRLPYPTDPLSVDPLLRENQGTVLHCFKPE